MVRRVLSVFWISLAWLGVSTGFVPSFPSKTAPLLSLRVAHERKKADPDIEAMVEMMNILGNKQSDEDPDDREPIMMEEEPEEEPKSIIDAQVFSADEAPELDVVTELKESEERVVEDEMYMREAIELAKSTGGERGPAAAFPKPSGGAVLVSKDGRILGRGVSNYEADCVISAITDAGVKVTPLAEWCVAWPSSKQLREDLSESTLYVTMEPSSERRGHDHPPITDLIHLAGIPNVVIGCFNPCQDYSSKGAAALHSDGLDVRIGVLEEECQNLVRVYSELANSKLHRMARSHFRQFGRPLGFLHCSVVDSDNVEAFARHGNAFGKDFGGKHLSFRDFGAYEIAPPPEVVWAGEDLEEEEAEGDFSGDIFEMEFEDETFQADMAGNPMMPWYEQVDAVVATFPRPGNGPKDDQSVSARLNGLRWLATHGEQLPAGVERILVMDATDLKDLPLTNDDPNLNLPGVDIQSFWKGENRKRTRVLLRRAENVQAVAAAEAAAKAAECSAKAALAAKEAIETGDAASAAEAAIGYEEAARAAAQEIQGQLQEAQSLKRRLMDFGVRVDTLEGGEPIDVMKHLGQRHGYQTVVWRAGCWGDRGVKAVLAGAFQWVSAHLAVDAVGGKFWQLMLAERAIQAACGPAQKVKVFAEQEDISLEYCDEAEADSDCILTVDGRPVRHVRLDCRVALVDDSRPREFGHAKTKNIDKKVIEEQAPWFL